MAKLTKYLPTYVSSTYITYLKYNTPYFHKTLLWDNIHFANWVPLTVFKIVEPIISHIYVYKIGILYRYLYILLSTCLTSLLWNATYYLYLYLYSYITVYKWYNMWVRQNVCARLFFFFAARYIQMFHRFRSILWFYKCILHSI